MEEKKQIIVPAIKEGTVIDHIPSRVTLKIMKLVDPQEFEHVITLGLNLFSQKIGKKGVIKISNRFLTEEEIEKIAILAPQATVNIIKNFEIEKKIKVSLPKIIEKNIKCPNPNCITNVERVTTRFFLESEEPLKFKCHYCERSIGRDDIVLN